MNMRKRLAGAALALMLCVSAGAVHADETNVLSAYGLPETQCAASDLVREVNVTEQIGDVTVSIDQTAYDGVSAYVRYSLKDAAATAPLAELDEETGLYLLTMDTCDYFLSKNAGWFSDSIWVNGEEYAMPSGESIELGTDQNGEIVVCLWIHLDEAGIEPTEGMTLGLPIGNPQAENKGILTVPLDGSVASRMQEVRFTDRVELDEICLTGVKTTVTPLKLYVSVAVEAQAEALQAQREKEQAAFDAQNIPMEVDDAWAGATLCSNWAGYVLPVTADGSVIEGMLDGVYGMYSAGATEARFEYLVYEGMPEEVYLAVCDEHGKAVDMQKAVRVL